MLISFNDLFHKNKSKNKSTSNIKIKQINLFLAFSNVGIYSGDGAFESDVGIFILHPKMELFGLMKQTRVFLIHMVDLLQRICLNLS